MFLNVHFYVVIEIKSTQYKKEEAFYSQTSLFCEHDLHGLCVLRATILYEIRSIQSSTDGSK